MRTKSLRGNQSKLLINYVKPSKEVSRDTLTRWVRQVMAQAGIDVSKFSPYSTSIRVSCT
jgi:site-specific recombinase XerD